MNEITEIEGWKVGDKVAVCKSGNPVSIRTIAKLSNGHGGTIFIEEKNVSGEAYFNKYDRHGNLRSAGTWDKNHIEKIDAEREASIRKMWMVRRTRNNLASHTSWKTMTDEQVLELAAIIKEKFNLDLTKKAE